MLIIPICCLMSFLMIFSLNYLSLLILESNIAWQLTDNITPRYAFNLNEYQDTFNT